MTDTVLTSSGIDPRVALATGVHAQPGVYALLLGSGVSTGAGVPTGWGVVRELARRVAAASGETPDDGFDPEEWWTQRFDKPLGYSTLLEELAATPAARRALLATFFEPSDEDREVGRRVPGPAHKAIASLVARGSVRAILTTNFDRLTEQALEGEGILPQVIASPHAVAGMEPLAHARCTVVKLHGDYATLDQLNTAEELSEYAAATNELLARVLDEYGLVVCGWSGEWDHALVAAIESTRVRRYPLYWSSYGSLSEAAKRLVGQHRAQVIQGVSADQFFPDLIGRLEAIDALAEAPLSRLMAVAQLKRYLPSESKHILLHDLLGADVKRVREHVREHPQQASSVEPAALEDLHTRLREAVDTLLHLVAHGVYFDRDRKHTDLWVWVIEQLMRARTSPSGTFNPWCDALQHYPALLALRTGVFAALAAGREDVLLELLRRPTWRDRLGGGRNVPAFAALHDYDVLDHDVVLSFPRWNGQRWLYPRSRLLRETLRPVLEPLVGDPDSYEQLCNRGEYRIALAQYLFAEEGSYSRAAPGEFIGEWQWSGGGLLWEADFRERGDHFAWGWDRDPEAETDPFSDRLHQLAEELEKSRRWG